MYRWRETCTAFQHSGVVRLIMTLRARNQVSRREKEYLANYNMRRYNHAPRDSMWGISFDLHNLLQGIDVVLKGIQMVMVDTMRILLLVLGGSGGGNELLSFVDTQAYWKTQSVTVSAESMLAELGDKSPAALLGPNPRSIRKLMAIRALGELKSAKATPTLEKLLKSKERFEAEYAAKAIAAIKGKASPPPGPTHAMLQKDLGVLPKDCGLVAQVSLASQLSGKGTLLADADKELEKMGVTREAALEQVTKMVLKVGLMVGNVRIDAVTVGLARKIGNNPDEGFFVVVARGLYNSQAANAIVGAMIRRSEEIDGCKVFHPDKDTALIFPSDNYIVFIAGPRSKPLPVVEVLSALKAGKSGLQGSPDLAKVVKTVDTKAPIWMAAEISESYREVPLLAPFNAITFVGKQAKDTMEFKLVAKGDDAEAIAQSVKTFEKGRTEAIRDMTRAVEHMPNLKPFLELVKSVKSKTNKAEVTITAKIKGGSSVISRLPLLYMSAMMPARSSAPPPPMVDDGF